MFKDLKEKIKEYCLWIVVIIIGIIAAFCVFYFSKNNEQAGLIGDTLSGVFTSLAFICAIFAVALQRKELSLQRKELKQTRDELRGQKEQFEIQNKTLKRQQFENTFFNMLARQEHITSSITYMSVYHGRQAFDYILYDLKRHLIKYGNTLTEIQTTYKLVCLNILGYYFCHLYRIMKFVNENKFLTSEEKSNYIDILRAGLSTNEILLLFYNGLAFDKTKEFIEEYKLLDPLIFEFLPIKKHIMLYNIKSYGNNEYLINLYNAFPIIKKILAEKLSSIDAKVYISDFGTELSCDLYFGLYLKDKKIDIDQTILVLDKEFKENLNSIKVNIFNIIEPKEDSVEFKYNNDSI